MTFGFKETFNNVLDTNKTINMYDRMKRKIKAEKKNHIAQLIGPLMIGNVLTILTSFIISIVAYGNSGLYLWMTTLQYLFLVLMNNLIFAIYLKFIRNEKMNIEDVKHYLHFLVIQITCAITLSFIQTIMNNTVLQICSFSAKLNLVVSILINLSFTMVNAGVSFCVLDAEKNVKKILKKAFSLVINNWKVLLMFSLLFITWNFVSNIILASIFYNQITNIQSINNIFHALLFKREYVLLLKVIIFYLINMIVTAYLEIYILLALAMFYEDTSY